MNELQVESVSFLRTGLCPQVTSGSAKPSQTRLKIKLMFGTAEQRDTKDLGTVDSQSP